MKKIRNVHIIGMGALGMLYGKMIMDAKGADSVSYVLDEKRFERYQNVENKVNGKTVTFPKISAREASPCDLLIVAVKFTGLKAAMDTMASSIGEDTIIISVMNGISSEEMIGERFGIERLIYTVAQGMDAMHFGNELQYTKAGKLCIGATKQSEPENLSALIEFFEEVKIPYTLEEDILYRMWSKFMLNVGINQTCMVYGIGYAAAMEIGSAAAVTLYGAMREVVLLAQAEGICLSEKEVKQYIEILKTLDPNATPSMGQDRLNKRPSEVEMFAGTVMRIAKKHGIPVPANEFLYESVQQIEAAY